MKTRSFALSMVLASLCVTSPAASAQGNSDTGIGVFTAVQGAVTVTHPRAARTQPVNLHDEVLFKDVIETREESRTKAFFDDESILTVGEQSRVEITEHIYNPERKIRRVVVELVRGRLRALVGRVFTGAGSKFEIHTPTAVAAVRGTYFVVWVENGMSGIVNIGMSGRVDLTSGGKTVTVAPGQYSVAADGEPPAPPLAYDIGSIGSKLSVGPATSVNKAAVMSTAGSVVAETTQTIGATTEKVEQTVGNTVGTVNPLAQRGRDVLATVKHAISDTVLQDTPKPESAKDAVRAMQPVVPTLPPASGILNATSGTAKTSTGETTLSTQSAPVGSVGPLAPVTSPVTSVAPVTSVVPIAPVVPGAPAVPVTPPAVVSGAAGTLGLPSK